MNCKIVAAAVAAAIALSACGGGDDPAPDRAPVSNWKLGVSDNGRYLVQADGTPFFWLGDTAWLMASQLSRGEIDQYFATRKAQGFNVAQIMLVHDMGDKSYYGVPALVDKDISRPNLPADSVSSGKYSFWDEVDYAVRKAEASGMYVAMVPLWGTAAINGSANGTPNVSVEQARAYATFLAKRYGSSPNVIWLDGGDVYGDNGMAIWHTIGRTLHEQDPQHLVTFHPRGRTTSSKWFHNEDWMAFNMFQSGHRNYEQDATDTAGFQYGEDNYRFVQHDLALSPLKPTLDGEPSYEDIVQGLHFSKQPAGTPPWNAADARRYAYWSVFAGATGHTYGQASVAMGFFRDTSTPGILAEYGPGLKTWVEGLGAEGATEMHFLKDLMLSRPYLERVPADDMVIDQDATRNLRHDHVVATRGKRYAFAYDASGRSFQLKMGLIEGDQLKASWFSPRDGQSTEIGLVPNKGVLTFDPPGKPAEGNDWVLVLDSQ